MLSAGVLNYLPLQHGTVFCLLEVTTTGRLDKKWHLSVFPKDTAARYRVGSRTKVLQLSSLFKGPASGAKIISAPTLTKTAEFEVENRRKSTKEANAEHFVLLLLFYFDNN